MATTRTPVPTDDPAEAITRVVGSLNSLWDKVADLEFDQRHLDMRIDQITPSTLNVNVIPTSKVVVAGVLVGVGLGAYIAYVEVQRRLKDKKSEPE